MDLILFGAGASYGSDTADTPPLGDDLFRALRTYNPPGWGALPADMADRFAGDFEAGMTAVADRYPHALPPLQRAMAAFFFNFVPRASNLYLKLADRARQSGWAGAVCTLNYDRLSELCFGRVGLQPVVGQDSEPGRKIELCMPHGCCHLFCDSARGAAGAVSFGAFNVTINGPVRVIADSREFQRRIQEDAFPPVMSYFEPQKRTTAGASFIESQRERWRCLARNAETIAIVGVRVRPRDTHIWAPLEATNARIVYCSGRTGATEYRTWAEERSHNRDVVLNGYFAEALDDILGELGI